MIAAAGQRKHQISLLRLCLGLSVQLFEDLQAFAITRGRRVFVARVKGARRFVIERQSRARACSRSPSGRAWPASCIRQVPCGENPARLSGRHPAESASTLDCCKTGRDHSEPARSRAFPPPPARGSMRIGRRASGPQPDRPSSRSVSPVARRGRQALAGPSSPLALAGENDSRTPNSSR